MKTQGLNAATKPLCPWQTELSPSRTRSSVTVSSRCFARVGGVDVGGARIGPHAQERDPARRLELGVERELVIQLGNAVVVGAAAGQVDVMAAGLEAGAHHFDVGGGQCRVQDDGGAGLPDGSGDLGSVAGVRAAARKPEDHSAGPLGGMRGRTPRRR